MAARYALYFIPARAHPLTVLGATWLGRDVHLGKACAQPTLEGISKDIFRELTASPRHYGFHATLKPPFALAPGKDETALRRVTAEYARSRSPFLLHLTPGAIGRFNALLETTPSPELRALAAACVTEFDSFRAAPPPEELEKRRAKGLTPHQDALLEQWGYPYVFDAFRFHMTLTTSIDSDELRQALLAQARNYFGEVLQHPVQVDALGLCFQPSRSEPFTVLERFPFTTA